ncbi:MAG: RNA-binding S4 domain-containing protein [Clostridiaceae bacterium]|jgi:ribosomal 50S subunit-recycling heat shock protein|nr:RNA-binding S4 domain-containing protein [Oscillospiraceae bacterium]NLO61947.1 RNA-binding S4 domain-containing protein [Clostridiaceae bacterium]
MRIDKFLKVSRIIKRRTVANEVCAAGRVSVNGRPAKPSAEIAEGDRIDIAFGNGTTSIRVLSVKDTVRKEDAQDMYEILPRDSGERI